MFKRFITPLHIFILANIAAAPLYELTSQYADFYVAHDSGAADILLMVAVLSLILPALTVMVIETARIFSEPLARTLHTMAVFLLLVVILLPVIKKLLATVSSNPDIFVVVAALGLAALFTFLYARSDTLRALMCLAAPAIIIIPVVFLFFSPVSDLISKRDTTGVQSPGANEFKKDTPVVMVVFDEFPITSIMDLHGNIDSALFPNFSRLARDSHWFRNATTVSATTSYSVPAILSGRFPGSEERIATLKNYPENLFTLLEEGYKLQVVESGSKLCPCEGDTSLREDDTERISTLFADLYILYLHILTPSGLSKKLPPVNLTWEGFATGGGAGNERAYKNTNKHLHKLPDFIDSIIGGTERTLYFIHTIFPHSPWIFYPSGNTYGTYGSGVSGGIPGLDNDQWWTTDEWPVIQAYQRHLLQVTYADRVIGRLIKKLEEEGIYDSSLIVVVSDHGISFRAGDNMRSVTKTNYPEIMSVPFFIKEPFQREGRISDRNVETIDILPSIADLLDIKIPWKVDGVSLFENDRPVRKKKVIYNGSWVKGELNKPYEFDSRIKEKGEIVKKKYSLFGGGLYKAGSDSWLLGREVIEFGSEDRSKYKMDKSVEDIREKAAPRNGFYAMGLLKGEILNPGTTGEKIRLALSINGKIESVTRTLEPEGGRAGFFFVVPEQAFGDEIGDIGIYEIAGADESPKLKAIANTVYSLVEDAFGEAISVYDVTSGETRKIPVDHNAMVGRLVDLSINDGGGGLSFIGWAADTLQKELPEKILIFVKEKYLTSAATKYESIEEAVLRGSPNKSSFAFTIPVQILNDEDMVYSDIRIFAVSRKGRATEINYLYGFGGIPRLLLKSSKSAEMVITSASGGVSIPVRPGDLKGELISIDNLGKNMVFSGWATDNKSGRYADAILLFEDGKLRNLVRTSHYLSELVEGTGKEGLIKSGFVFEVPMKHLTPGSELRLFAFSNRGIASELSYPKGFVVGK